MPRKKNKDKRDMNNIPFSKTNPIDDIKISEEDAMLFLNKILKGNIKREKDLKVERMSDYGNLVGVNSEWLDSFMIIGYDLNGDGVFITKAATIKDQNALMELLKKVFISMASKG